MAHEGHSHLRSGVTEHMTGAPRGPTPASRSSPPHRCGRSLSRQREEAWDQIPSGRCDHRHLCAGALDQHPAGGLRPAPLRVPVCQMGYVGATWGVPGCLRPERLGTPCGILENHTVPTSAWEWGRCSGDPRVCCSCQNCCVLGWVFVVLHREAGGSCGVRSPPSARELLRGRGTEARCTHLK